MNLVSAATDDSEKVFQEAIEQVNREFNFINLLIAANYFVAISDVLCVSSQDCDTLPSPPFSFWSYVIESRFQGMTGKGWAWIGTDGATTSPFTESPNLQRAMQGMIGTRPKIGEGPLYQRLLKIWKEKDATSYPGLVHSPRSQEVGD